ncbi:MAG: DNA polymerase III subunit beta [Clostridia bacterium]
MKIVCNGMDLADALSKVSKALPIKRTIPILDGIKLSAYGNTLTLSATDIDFSISKEIKTDIQMEGEVLVNGKLLNEFARKLSTVGQVSLSDINENTLAISYDDSIFSIKLMNLAEYPPIQNVEYDVSFNILQKDLKELFNQTIFSAATDDIRPILKGCLIEIAEDKIRCVALDGYRLAIATKQLYQKEINYSAVAPAKSLSEVAKLLEEDEKSVNIKINKNKLYVDLDHTKISTALLSGTFITYASTIPKGFESQVVINKKMFEEAIERASIMSKFEKTNLIKIEIKDEKMYITSNSEMGDAKEIISVKINGKDMLVGFNAKYISECLKAINDEFIQLDIKSPAAPCVIRPVETENFLYLILPVRIK